MQSSDNVRIRCWWYEPTPWVGSAAAIRFFSWLFGGRKFEGSKVLVAMLLLVGTQCSTAQTGTASDISLASIVGTWTLAFANVVHADGSLDGDYGGSPKGLLQIDRAGRYSIFVFDQARPKFARGEKKLGTDAEVRAAFLGTSSHYGTVSVDSLENTLEFHIDGSTYPNWEGTTQRRPFRVDGNILSYRVPARPNGDVPTTAWKRIAGNVESK